MSADTTKPLVGILTGSKADWEVSFVAREAPAGERYVKLLQQRGVATYVGVNAEGGPSNLIRPRRNPTMRVA